MINLKILLPRTWFLQQLQLFLTKMWQYFLTTDLEGSLKPQQKDDPENHKLISNDQITQILYFKPNFTPFAQALSAFKSQLTVRGLCSFPVQVKN